MHKGKLTNVNPQELQLSRFKRMQKVGCQTRGIYTKKTSQRIHVSPQQLILKS